MPRSSAPATTLKDERETTHAVIIVGTRGDAPSAGALKAARQLATKLGATVRVLTVFEPMPIIAPEYGVLVPMPDNDAEREQSLLAAVRLQVKELVGDDPSWSVEMQRGDPVTTISRAAHAMHARLIVVGLGKHGLMERLFGSETALHILRRADTPVLAVPPDHASLPRRAVVAVDFSDASRRALHSASTLLGPFDTMKLVHVAPRVDSAADIVTNWEGDYLSGLNTGLERLRGGLEVPPSTTVESVLLRGDPAKEVVRYSEREKADLIVAGSHGHGFVERLLIGSVATGILRGATSAVMIVPEPRHFSHTASWSTGRAEGTVIELTDPRDWAAELQEFTRRNVARMSVLEIDDPDLGAQSQEVNYPFLGASYDPHDQRIEIMLGDDALEGRHLTRGIGHVREVDLMKDNLGRDLVLRVLHGKTQTLLRLVH